MVKVILVLCVVLSWSVQAANLAPNSIRSIVLLNEYVEKTGGQIINDTTRVSNLVNVEATTRTLRQNTWEIPNRLGTGFAIVVGFVEIPVGLEQFNLQVSYPEMELPTGENRSVISRPIDISGHDGTFIWGFEFFFDFPYEATPGDWEFKIFSQGHMIHSSRFTVVDDATML